MKIWLAAVGRARAGAARDLYEEYARRMTWPLTLKEVESKKRAPPDELKRLEADLLLAAVPNTDMMLALGPMTWPHLMVRAMIAEQLYRAQQILAGHPYHRA